MNVAVQTAPSVHHLFAAITPPFVTRTIANSTNRRKTVRACDYLHTMFVREFEDGLDIDQVLLVREVEARQKRDGSEFLKLTLADKTGCVPAMIWDRVAEFAELVKAGAPVRVIGRYGNHSRYGPADQRARPARPVGRELLARRPARRAGARGRPDGGGPPRAGRHHPEPASAACCSTGVFGEGSSFWERYREAPAAKYYHQAYRHGLLEHSLGVAQARQRDLRHLPGHRPGRRGDGRAAPRHRQARGLHARSRT